VKRGMKVYIAGPMTGYPHANAPAFIDAQVRWQEQGHVVQTPLDANGRVWERHYGVKFDPFVDKCDYGDPLLPQMFAEDLKVVAWADAVAVLPGWEKSRGVARELSVALLLGKRVFDAKTMDEIKLDCEIRFFETPTFLIEAPRRLIASMR
jgi:hypothetical protein